MDNQKRAAQERLKDRSATGGTGWVPSVSTFGARLALLRQAMHWGNVKQAADLCGIPVQTWRMWEREDVEPRGLITVCMKIAGVTGVDYRWLALGATVYGEIRDDSGRVVATLREEPKRVPVDRSASDPVHSAGDTLRYPSLGERVVAVGMADRPIAHPATGSNTRSIVRARPLVDGRPAGSAIR